MNTYATENIRNVAIVGHSGSGKTMLAEHMLYTAGAADRVGTIEAGSTHSDFDPLEVKRGISISSAIMPLEWNGVKINLIDVPGFPDFAGDLEAVARIVDAMILVVEAKSDLDVGFDLAWEAAERNGISRCIFVNKLERDNADYEGLMNTLQDRYGSAVVNVQIPIGSQGEFSGVLDLLNMKVYRGRDRGVDIAEIPADYTAEAALRREKMMDGAAEGDDDLAVKYLEGQDLTAEEIEHGLLMGSKDGRVFPVLLGSAATGIGVATLLDRIVGELPSPLYHPFTVGDQLWPEDDGGPFVGFVFKTTSDPYIGKISYVRVFSGILRADDFVQNSTQDHEEKVHHLLIPHGKETEACREVRAGDICAIAKLAQTNTGDTLCARGKNIQLAPLALPEPIYRVAIEPATKADEDKMGPALEKLLAEDPTLRWLREPSTHQELLVGLGDIHIDTTVEKLKARFGVMVKTVEAKIPYKETIRGSAKAQGKFKRQTGGKGQYGDCWLEVSPLSRGEGFLFESAVVGGAIPKSYIPAVEKGVREAMDRGFLSGHELVDVRAVVYDGSYHEVDSSEMAFKQAAQIGFRACAEKAQAVILEPIWNVAVDVPDEAVGDVVGDLNTRRGHMLGMEPSRPGRTLVRATMPMATMARYALDLRSLTKGRGRFTGAFSHYDELPQPQAENLVKAYQAAHSSAELH